MAAQAQDADAFAAVDGPGTEAFDKLRLENARIPDTNPEIIGLLLLRQDNQGFYIVLDAAEQDAAPYGQRYPSGTTLEQHFDSLIGAFSDAQISSVGGSPALAAYTPIFASDGRKVGAAVVTLDASSVIQKQSQALLTAVLVVLLVVSGALLLAYALSNSLANPIIRLTRAAEQTVRGEVLTRFQVTGGDEVESLAGSLNAMASRLQEVVDGLEARVRERSIEADVATDQAERRILQLETVSEVACIDRDTVRDLDRSCLPSRG